MSLYDCGEMPRWDMERLPSRDRILQLRGSDTRTESAKRSLEEDGPQLEHCPLAPGVKYVLRKLRWEWHVSRTHASISSGSVGMKHEQRRSEPVHCQQE